jgi:hypothetical protein
MNVIGPRPSTPRVTGMPAAPAKPAPEAAPAEAVATPAKPPAAEATLWDVLSAEEREFFTQQQALGPLTYRPDGGTRGGMAPPTGRRIDVRG